MTHQRGRADYGTISLGGYAMALAAVPNESVVNIHSRPVNQGDPGPNDHPTNSTWIQSDWTGGGQLKKGKPDSVTGRFWFATSETEPAQTITLPPLPGEWIDPGASGNACVGLGVYDDKEWAAWGSDIRFLNHGTGAWDDIASNLTGAPVKKGCVFVPKTGALAGVDVLCIPLGSSFDYINGTAKTNVAKSAVDLIVYDNKLFRLGSDGSFEYTIDLTAWSGATYVPDGSKPQRLGVYLTVGGEPTIYVVTSGSVWVWDSMDNTLVQSQLIFPRHPDQGKAAETWRGEFYVSVGDGAHRYNRSTIVPAGIDRDQALPDEYRGIFVDFAAGYNALYAIMSGVEQTVSQEDDPYYFMTGDDYMTAAVGPTTSLVLKWNGFGWHYIADQLGSAPTSIFVSDAQSTYALFWSADKKMYRVPLSRTYLNLQTDTQFPVKQSSWFESSWYNYGWEGQTKILKSFELFVDNATDEEYVVVKYRTHEDHGWSTLGTITTPGEHAFYYGLVAGATVGSTDPNDYRGIPCEKVQYRFELYRGSNIYKKPIIRWWTSSVRKMLRPVRTFRCVLNLTRTQGYTSDELSAVLRNAVRQPYATEFTYMNETMQVDVVALELSMVPSREYEQSAGTKLEYIAKVNLIESNETMLPHDADEAAGT